jgi:hypothetical protein
VTYDRAAWSRLALPLAITIGILLWRLRTPGPLPLVLGLWVLALGALTAANVLHELGHRIGCRLAGFRVTQVRVGPRTVNTMPLRVRLGRTASWFGGEVVSDRVTPRRLRARDVLTTTCGLVAPLLLAAALALAGAMTTELPVHIVLWLLAVVVAFDPAVSMVPWPLWGVGPWSDGMWLLRWLLTPRRAAQRRAVGALTLTLAPRPAEWDAGWLRFALGQEEQPSNGDAVTANLLAYGWALDLGEVDQAARYLSRAVVRRELVEPAERAKLLVESAFFTARYYGDAARAERLLAEASCEPEAASVNDLARAEAAVHLAAGRWEEALPACERAVAGMPVLGEPYGSFAVLDRVHVEAMREQALHALGRLPAGTGAGP